MQARIIVLDLKAIDQNDENFLRQINTLRERPFYFEIKLLWDVNDKIENAEFIAETIACELKQFKFSNSEEFLNKIFDFFGSNGNIGHVYYFGCNANYIQLLNKITCPAELITKENPLTLTLEKFIQQQSNSLVSSYNPFSPNNNFQNPSFGQTQHSIINSHNPFLPTEQQYRPNSSVQPFQTQGVQPNGGISTSTNLSTYPIHQHPQITYTQPQIPQPFYVQQAPVQQVHTVALLPQVQTFHQPIQIQQLQPQQLPFPIQQQPVVVPQTQIQPQFVNPHTLFQPTPIQPAVTQLNSQQQEKLSKGIHEFLELKPENATTSVTMSRGLLKVDVNFGTHAQAISNIDSICQTYNVKLIPGKEANSVSFEITNMRNIICFLEFFKCEPKDFKDILGETEFHKEYVTYLLGKQNVTPIDAFKQALTTRIEHYDEILKEEAKSVFYYNDTFKREAYTTRNKVKTCRNVLSFLNTEGIVPIKLDENGALAIREGDLLDLIKEYQDLMPAPESLYEANVSSYLKSRHF